MGEEKIVRGSTSKQFITFLAFNILVVMVIGVSMATFTFTRESNQINTISTGNITFEYTEDTNGINITNAAPMSDTMGKKLTDAAQYFDFTIRATLDTNTATIYEISAEKTLSSTLNDQEVKLYLERREGNQYVQVLAPTVFTPLTEVSAVGTPAGEMVLEKNKINKTVDLAYRLRMWVADTTVVGTTPQSFGVRVNVHAMIEA